MTQSVCIILISSDVLRHAVSPLKDCQKTQYYDIKVGFINSKNWIKGLKVMSRVCQVTGKKPISGNNVSHANNRNKRRFLPNLHSKRIWVASENRWVRLRLTQAGLRLIDKKGIDVVLADMRARKVI